MSPGGMRCCYWCSTRRWVAWAGRSWTPRTCASCPSSAGWAPCPWIAAAMTAAGSASRTRPPCSTVPAALCGSSRRVVSVPPTCGHWTSSTASGPCTSAARWTSSPRASTTPFWKGIVDARGDEVHRAALVHGPDAVLEVQWPQVGGTLTTLREDPQSAAGTVEQGGRVLEALPAAVMAAAIQGQGAHPAEEGQLAQVLGVHDRPAQATQRLVEHQ